ncbi:Hpt domain-containing protein [Pseudothauera lacus]|uniref:Chemotaxis protein CheA n=1 Tax=Pseudothauera lacus TaxID=2136175 RepID=A0A2T4IFW1_9RHOO|nr:Hpt domain-containing protein [Pseudothauera lacus]PTD96648.1 hybrid sensor histidine kinase/response regulator [Pseudothauera lacus]
MTHPTELDLGPLTWVKGEIDLSLGRAAEALDEAAQAEDAGSRIQFAQNHLHQARGALSIVGLDGLTHFADTLDQLLGSAARAEITVDGALLSLGRRALAAIGNYLEELVHGAADQPLRLAGLYAELLAARGSEGSAADLFFPDLSLRPKRRPPPLDLDERRLRRRLRRLRTHYEQGLLGWLRNPQDKAAITAMREAVTGIEQVLPGAPARALWWASLALLDGLAAGTLASEPPIRKLCAQLDAQQRRTLGGSAAVPDRLMRELLYHVACIPASTPHQQAVRRTWYLDALMPEPGATVSDAPLAPLLQSLRTRLGQAKETWDEFTTGSASALPRFEQQLHDALQEAPQLGRPAFVRLLDGLDSCVQWLRKDPLQLNETLSMEVATALLLGESALERGGPDAAFSGQVADTIKRLAAFIRGEALEAAETSATTLGARRNQERDALAQLSREILSSLAHVEQTLDDFFRNNDKRAPLATLAGPLHQIEGALTLLGDDEAIALLHDAADTIAGFAADSEAPPAGAAEDLAHRLSALGFYIEALQHGPARLARFLDPDAEEVIEEAPEEEEDFLDLAVPAATGHTAADTPAAEAAVAPAQAPADAFADDGEDDEDDGEGPALVGLDRDDFEAEPAPAPLDLPARAPDTQRLIEASEEEIDAELLEIFIEEAHDVLASIDEHLELSRTEPSNTEYLTAIRRGFHTLKGSGRMVGLREFGEAAWGLEQTLNRWLQFEWAPTPALHHLVDAAHQTFSEWVAQLEGGGAHGYDASAVLGEAERLRSTEEPLSEPGTLPSAAPPESPAASSAAVPPEEDPALVATTLAFDLDLSEDGEVLPVAHEQPDSGFLPAETSLEIEEFLDEDEPPPSAPEPVPESIDFDLSGPDVAPATEPPATEQAPVAEAAPATAAESDELAALPTATVDFELDFPELDANLPAAGIETAEPSEQPASVADDLGVDIALAESAAPADELPALAEVDESPIAPPADPGVAEHPNELPELPASAAAAPTAAETSAAREAEAEDGGTDEHPEQPETSSAVGIAADEAVDMPPSEGDYVRIGDSEISRPLFDLYLAEAAHHISVLHQEFDRLQANPTLPPPEPAVRAAHTLAGISGTARLEPPHLLGRAMEHALARCRDQQHAPSGEQTALLRSALDTLEAMVAEVATRSLPLPVPELAEQLEAIGRYPLSEEPALSAEVPAPAATPAAEASVVDTVTSAAAAPVVESEPAAPVHDEIDAQLLPIFLEEGGELLTGLHAALRAWRAEPGSAEHPHSVARQLHTLKGSARMTGAMNLGEHVHQMESRFESLRKGAADPGALIDELVAGLDIVEQSIDILAGGGIPAAAEAAQGPAEDTTAAAPATAIEVAAEQEAAAGSAMLRVRADAVDSFVNQAGEIGIARTRIEGELRTLRRSLLDLTENVIRLRNQLREVEIQAEVQMQSRIAQAESHHAEFDPLEMDRYTRLQELTRMMAESVNDVTTVQQNLLKNLDGADVALHSQARMSRELQQALMQVRMVPFDSLADRLYRIVRQSAKELGKRANLDLRGGRIELDRGVLEHMVAPLEHLLRNSVAHGIEDADRRRSAGKDEIGEITLTVKQEGNEIAIELADDGAGLDFERIAERARANGLLGADEQADEKRLTNLIFVPGFSTAGSLSTISGRGVGMDVVKSETAAAGGRIDVSSVPGSGTRFRIYLPLTLAVTQALLVRAGQRTYAIPSSMIAQVLELKAAPLAALVEAGGTDWQGEHYSYRYLTRLLGDSHAEPEVQRFNWVLLLRAGAQTLALHVDALRGNQEIVVKNAGPQIARLVGVSGATVLGDGEIVLILNPVALASRSLGGSPAEDGSLIGGSPAPAAARIPTILVVDDSLTVRKIASRLLEREGYQVLTAKDGVDALEKLLDTVPDVILSDIEMPRMDGFDLVRNIRADERTRKVPVIMITSRLAEKHRRYAEEVGANHYLGKPYQEEELLALLAGYTGRS